MKKIGYEKNNRFIARLIIFGCSQKAITEEQAIQVAKDDLKIDEKEECSVIVGNNS